MQICEEETLLTVYSFSILVFSMMIDTWKIIDFYWGGFMKMGNNHAEAGDPKTEAFWTHVT